MSLFSPSHHISLLFGHYDKTLPHYKKKHLRPEPQTKQKQTNKQTLCLITLSKGQLNYVPILFLSSYLLVIRSLWWDSSALQLGIYKTYTRPKGPFTNCVDPQIKFWFLKLILELYSRKLKTCPKVKKGLIYIFQHLLNLPK